MPAVLTTASQVTCMHGGQVILTTANGQMTVNGSPALLQTDIHQVAGCPFVIGLVPSPCIQVMWQSGAATMKVNEVAVLTQASIGLCQSAAGAPQGVAIVVMGDPLTDAL